MIANLFRRRPSRSAVALPCTFALLLGGCAVGPDYRAPDVVLPAQWANATKTKPTAARNLGRWWAGLKDPMLNTLMSEAVAGNLDVAAAKARIREARANRRQAIAALLPLIDGSDSLTRERIGNSTPSDAAPIGNSPYTLYQAGFDASFELDLFGANKRGAEASTRALEAADDDLDSTLLTLLGDVASYYTEARGYQARIALATRSSASQRETAALTRQKFAVGSASAVDVAKADALAASTEANIPQLASSYSAAVHRLGILLGREPSALTAGMNRQRPIPAPRQLLKAGVPADVLLRRPDVRRAERQLAQYTAKIGVAEAALYPSVSLTGSISTQAQKAGDLAKGSTIGWSWGPTATVPIFSGGSLRAGVDIADAQRDQYLSAFRSAVLTALEDTENALVALAKERQRAGKLAESAKSYGEAARLSRTLYQTGASSFLDVLDAERSAYSAEDTLIQSRVAITTDYIALAKALGGGWDAPVDTTTPAVVDAGTGPHPFDWASVNPAR